MKPMREADRIDNVPSEVRIVLKRFEDLNLGVKPLRSTSLKIHGIETDLWEFRLEPERPIEIFLYVVKKQGDAESISKFVSGTYPHAISGHSLLVLKGKEVREATTDAILSAYSGEE